VIVASEDSDLVLPNEKTEGQPEGGTQLPAENREVAGYSEERTEIHPNGGQDGAAPLPPLPEDKTVIHPTPPLRSSATSPDLQDDVLAHARTVPAEPPGPDRNRAQLPTLLDRESPNLGGKPRPQLPGYEILSPLGTGTYGEVWLAREERTGIQVAIKFFAHGTGLQWQLVQAEVKQLARLHADPGIVQLLDVELSTDPPYYVMAYADQGSLAKRLEKGRLPVDEALEIFRQLTEALAYVHAKGIRHCDLKPGNVLLNARQRALLADFGQAHLSSDATPALGTFFYMAPEQADLSKQIPDTRWDVYGLGAIFYAMLTGHPPHEDPGMRDLLAGTVELSHRLERYREWIRKAPRPMKHQRIQGIDRDLVEIIDRCLEVNPDKRLHDAGAVLTALSRRERRLRQRPLLVFGFVAQVLLFLVMAGVALWAFEAGTAQSKEALVNQLLESDQTSASLIAGGLQEELVSRKATLETHAADPRFRAAVENKDREILKNLLKKFNRQHRRKPLSWLVVDSQGTLLALELNVKLPPDFKTPQQFGWRDWFHGNGDQPNRQGDKFLPIRKTHISVPFRRLLEKVMGIGISTPIFAPGSNSEIVGVLYTPVNLKDIYRWLDHVKIKNGFAVLVDARGHCLLHRDQDRIQPAPREQAPRWDSPVFEAAVKKTGTIASYRDPVDHRIYLAGYAPLPKLGWGAIVQHERQAALKPIADLKNEMVLIGAIQLLTVTVLMSALWGWLIWSLRRKDRVAQA
jgi:serine/threonine protein kinase